MYILSIKRGFVMNTHQLKCFVEVAECGSMTRAAERLMISPPALSCTVSRLEQEMGVEFFNRTGRQLQLNDSGKVMAICWMAFEQ